QPVAEVARPGLAVEERPPGDAADVALLADPGLQGVGVDLHVVVGLRDPDLWFGGRRGQGEQGQQDGGQSSHEAPLSRNADAYQTTGRSPDYNSSFGGRLGKQQERAVARDRSPAAGRFALHSPGGELGWASTGGPSAWGNERVLAGE